MQLIEGLAVGDPELSAVAERSIRDHVLMRDVFHCTPVELGEVSEADIELHWKIREAIRRKEENEVQYQRSKPQHGR